MNTEALFLFLILLLGLVLCSFLGGNCGYEGFDNAVPNGAEFVGENGGKLVVNVNSDGTQNLDVTLPNGEKIKLISQKDTKKEDYTDYKDRNVQVFYGPNGERGEVITENNGRVTIRIEKNNTIYMYNPHTGKSVTITGAATPSIVKYDNYQHGQENSTGIPNGAEFIGQNGGKLVVNTNSDGTQKLDITLPSGEKVVLLTKKEKQSDTFLKNTTDSTSKKIIFYGPNGEKGEVITAYDGKVTINVEKNNTKYIFNPHTGYGDMSSTQYYGSTGYHVEPNNGSATSSPYNNNQSSQGNQGYQSSQGNQGNQVGQGYNNNQGNQGYNNQGNQGYNNNQGNQGYNSQGSQGSQGSQSSQGSQGSQGFDYSNSLPAGVSRNMIPPGDEDLYILKSQVVPPVCPACPATNNFMQNLEKIQEAKCPPCPRPQRCPEPSFECKKVPNYNAIGNDELPIPVLNDFSTFGM